MRDYGWEIFVILIIVMTLAAVGLAAAADGGRQECIKKHEVCVVTTDGWKPYAEPPK